MATRDHSCCSFPTFWESFMYCWRRDMHLDDLPDWIVTRAKRCWRAGMIGHEAVKTIRRELSSGKL